MAFDPSVIGSIGADLDTQAPYRGLQQGFSLKDAVNREQFNRLELNAKKKQAEDQETARNILKNADYSNPESLTKVASQLTKAGLPDQGMQLMKMGQQYQSGEIELQRQKLELASAQQDALVSSIDPIVSQLDEMKSRGATPAMLDAQAKLLATQTLPRLQQDRPDLAPIIQKFAQNPQSLTYNGLKAAEMQSKQGQAMARQRLEEIRVRTQERNVESEIRAREKKAEGGFTPEEGDLLAALTERGVSIPQGLRSKEQMKANLSRLIANNPNQSAGQIADKIKAGQLQFGAEKKETQVAAGIAGKIRYAENEIKQLAPLVMEASAKVPRGKFVPWNKLSQMADSSISDPDLKELKSYLTTLSNAYDMLAARGGTDKEKREENRRNLMAADGPEALKRAVDVMVKEAEVSDIAASQSMVPRAGGTPQGGGQILRFDAQGNPVQ